MFNSEQNNTIARATAAHEAMMEFIKALPYDNAETLAGSLEMLQGYVNALQKMCDKIKGMLSAAYEEQGKETIRSKQ